MKENEQKEPAKQKRSPAKSKELPVYQQLHPELSSGFKKANFSTLVLFFQVSFFSRKIYVYDIYAYQFYGEVKLRGFSTLHRIKAFRNYATARLILFPNLCGERILPYVRFCRLDSDELLRFW